MGMPPAWTIRTVIEPVASDDQEFLPLAELV